MLHHQSRTSCSVNPRRVTVSPLASPAAEPTPSGSMARAAPPPGVRPHLRAVHDAVKPPHAVEHFPARSLSGASVPAGRFTAPTPQTVPVPTAPGTFVRDPPLSAPPEIRTPHDASRSGPLHRPATTPAPAVAPTAARTVIAVTADPRLRDQIAGLAATAGARLEHRDPSASSPHTGSWEGALPGQGDTPALLLLGADALDLRSPTRDQAPEGVTGRAATAPPTIVVTNDPPPEHLWRQALELGAENVAVLPRAESWLLDRVLDAVLPVPGAAVLGVTGGRGGSGTSTLAVALALTAVAGGVRPVLVDADPLGGGLDLALGAENMSGVRWPELLSVRGRLGSGQLCSALPDVDGVGLLSWDRQGQDPSASVPAGAVTSVLEAAAREFDLIVLDLPRRLDPAARAAASACHVTVLLVPAEVRAGAAAGRVAAGLEQLDQHPLLVVRGPSPTGLPAEAIAATIGVPLVGEVRTDPAVAAALDRGEPPPLPERGALSGLCRRLLTEAWPL
jgi:secretion/DNA translocation related CpaE-like protein